MDQSLSPISPITHLQTHAAQMPNGVAIQGPTLTLTWKQLAEQVALLAGFLKSQNISPGSGVLIRTSPELERIYLLAALKTGLFSASEPAVIDSQYLISIGFRYLLTSDSNHQIEGLKTVLVPPTLRADGSALESISEEFQIGDISRVVFSSGTTGSPKAIPFSADLLARRIRAANDHYMAESPFLTTLGLGTISGNTCFYLDLWRGTTHFVPGSASYNWKVIQSFGIKGVMCSPSSLELLVREAEASPSTTSLKVAETAGGFLNPRLAERATLALRAKIINIYGSTEAGLVTNVEASNGNPFLAGAPYPGVNIRIEDEAGEILPTGAEGVVAVQTPYQAPEYLSAPKSESGKFDRGFFYSGDMGKVDEDGNLHLSGRVDDLINLNGQKINPHPIEAEALARFNLSEAVCVLAENQNGKSFHVMFVVSDQVVDTISIEKALYSVFRTRAPQKVMQIDSVPKNAMGKIPRHALIETSRGDV